MKNIKYLIPEIKLTDTEKFLVNYINKNPDDFINLKINEISIKANVSTSCITRLSKKLGFKNFKEFQINISNNLNYAKQNIGFVNGDNLETSINNLKFFHSYSIKETLDGLNINQIEKLISKINKSKKILFYGVGSSYLACNELSNNLEKIGFHTIINQDYHQILLQLPQLSNNDLIILISKTGDTREIKYLIKKANELNIKIALITTKINIKDNVDFLITFKTYEQEKRITAISSKVAQLVLVDLIYMEIFKLNNLSNNDIILLGTNIIKEWNL